MFYFALPLFSDFGRAKWHQLVLVAEEIACSYWVEDRPRGIDNTSRDLGITERSQKMAKSDQVRGLNPG